MTTPAESGEPPLNPVKAALATQPSVEFSAVAVMSPGDTYRCRFGSAARVFH